jgi:hypothetical protein
MRSQVYSFAGVIWLTLLSKWEAMLFLAILHRLATHNAR